MLNLSGIYKLIVKNKYHTYMKRNMIYGDLIARVKFDVYRRETGLLIQPGVIYDIWKLNKKCTNSYFTGLNLPSDKTYYNLYTENYHSLLQEILQYNNDERSAYAGTTKSQTVMLEKQLRFATHLWENDNKYFIFQIKKKKGWTKELIDDIRSQIVIQDI